MDATDSLLDAAAARYTVELPPFAVSTVGYLVHWLNWFLSRIPGGYFISNYLEKAVHDDPYRSAVEIGLILYGIYFYLSKPQRKKSLQSNKSNLSKQEIELLLDDWQPEPLTEENQWELQKIDWRLAKVPIVINGIQNYISLTRNNDSEKYDNVFNLASNNFLQLSTLPRVNKLVKDVIRNYGVGACGPAGFYGNQDVHYNLEYDLARFFGTESAVLYGQDFSVSPSVLPAFTKRGDVIVADDQVSLSLQNALQLSRSTVYYFEHNNMKSLDNLLTELNKQELKENLPQLPRKFIVTEALFANTGDIAPLPDLVSLKLKHKYRLFVDETLSLGVLGATGRGLPEFFNMDRATAIDVTIGSLATALGSTGGFALGDNVMSYHQHIGSNAYCFSASLPAYCVASVSEVLKIMDQDNSAVKNLNHLSQLMFNQFKSMSNQLDPFFVIKSNENSPILHIELNPQFRLKKFKYTKEDLYDYVSVLQKRCASTIIYDPFEDEEKFLQEIVDNILINENILITRNTIVIKQESLPIVPSLKICCNAQMNETEVTQACQKIISWLLNATK